MDQLTHVDEKRQPTMVDISTKLHTERMAIAQSQIQFPEAMREHIRDGEIHLKKGPVFQTAVIAGSMAVKKTADAIPFCHQIPIDSCKFRIELDDSLKCTIRCEVKTTSKTGVEMEALHGAMIAALTVYDMCKALSHQIVINETKLVAKTGGKNTILDRPLCGLVLTGGKSTRMQRDKALIEYHGTAHAKFIFDILSQFCGEVFLSSRKDQWPGTPLASLPIIEDIIDVNGPTAGILSAFAKYPDANWLVVACDLVHFNTETVKHLLANYDTNAVATCYASMNGGFPEALCALYTPYAKTAFEAALKQDIRCPVKILAQASCHVISQTGSINLANINTPKDLLEVQH